MKGKLIYGQSGGPSPVINASAYGVIKEALKHDDITNIYVMKNGIEGLLNGEFYTFDEFEDQLELLPFTPASAFGSCRHKMKDYKNDDREYAELLRFFQANDIRYFLYNGGNDSMDTCLKISDFVKQNGYEMNVIGIPKTIDNDLPYTDHTPGFASAAKFIANTVMQLKLDSIVYPTGKVTIVEIMGRHAGWLAASAHLANVNDLGPDLVYLPENTFDAEKFFVDVARIYREKKQCLICVSEGIKNKDGEFIGSLNAFKDAFGHTQLGGVAMYLGDILEDKLGMKYRAIELSTIQRSAGYSRSKRDVEEAIAVGRFGVKQALKNETGKMVIIKRVSSVPYKVKYDLHDVSQIANMEQVIPKEYMINENEMSPAFYEYMLPLIEGEEEKPYKNGLQEFFKLQ
jgi:6-phosphofructokinase